MRPARRFSLLRFATPAALIVATASGCRRDVSNMVRGRGLSVASLTPDAQAGVYEAAARGAFDVDDPSLSLLLDARQLPRTVGLAAEGRVASGVTDVLRRRNVIRGSCEPALQGVAGVPLCPAARPGYIVRFSPVFSLKADSVQVYMYVQKYDIPNAEHSQTLRFERAYQVVKQGSEWRAAREGRVPKEARGER